MRWRMQIMRRRGHIHPWLLQKGGMEGGCPGSQRRLPRQGGQGQRQAGGQRHVRGKDGTGVEDSCRYPTSPNTAPHIE